MTRPSWRSIGAVVSILWVLGAPVFAWDVYSEYESEHAEIARLKCMLDFDQNPGARMDSSACMQTAREQHSRRICLAWRELRRRKAEAMATSNFCLDSSLMITRSTTCRTDP